MKTDKMLLTPESRQLKHKSMNKDNFSLNYKQAPKNTWQIKIY